MVLAPQATVQRLPHAAVLRELPVPIIDVAMPLQIEVTAGLIQDAEGRYLITQRRRGTHLEGLWEFPGGKRAAGEDLPACLQRELTEELGARFTVGEKVETVRWDYPDRTIVLHFYRCRLESGTIEARESQAMAWVAPAELSRYDFPPADRDIVRMLAG